MKLLRNLLDNVRPHFSKGGRFEKLHYGFDALSTFLFVPGATTTGTGVHVRDAMDLKRTMMTVIISLVPCLIFGMWNVGFQHYKAFGIETSHFQNLIFGFWKVLPMIIVSYAAGLGVEFIFSILRNHPVSEGYLVTGMLIPLTLPVTTPLWMIAMGAVFCTLLGKEVFGGTGFNFMNPALLARAFLFFAFPAFLTGDVWTDLSPEAGRHIVDGFSGATNLVTFDTNFHKLPDGMTLFWGFEQGSVGETSVLACLIGAFILIVTGVGSARIMISVFLGAYLVGVLLNVLAPASDMNHSMHTPPHVHLLMGGFAFGAIFMATDPVSAAHTATGKIIYGLLIGGGCVALRVFNPAYPEGMMLSILLMNVFAPLIDHIVVERHIQRRMKKS